MVSRLTLALAAGCAALLAGTGLLADPGTASGPGQTVPASDAVKWAPRLFFDTAVLAGAETQVRYYEESFFRFHSELGVELHRRPALERSLRAIGLAISASTGAGDGRLGIGPRVTWQLNRAWSLQGSGGLLWSTEEEESGLTDQGWQLRTGLVYKDEMAATVLWQALPYDLGTYARPGMDNQGTLHSIYGGVMFHKKPGTILSVALWGTLAAMVVVFALTYPAS